MKFEDGHEQGHGGHGAFATAQQENVLETLAGGRSDDVDTALVDVCRIGKAHFAGTAIKEDLVSTTEVFVDLVEGILETLLRFDVDFLDGLFGIADGIEEVLALRVEEVVALLGLFEFLKRIGIDRAKSFDLAADFGVLLFGFSELRFVEDGCFGGCEFSYGDAEFLLTGLFEMPDVALLADEFDFRLLTLIGE